MANSIAVIDAGQVIAEGTSNDLKAQVGGTRLVLIIESAEDVGRAVEIMRKVGDGTEPTLEELTICVPVTEGAGVFAEVVRDLDAASVRIADLGLRRPTLDDVFLRLTGHTAETMDQPPTEGDGATNR